MHASGQQLATENTGVTPTLAFRGAELECFRFYFGAQTKLRGSRCELVRFTRFAHDARSFDSAFRASLRMTPGLGGSLKL